MAYNNATTTAATTTIRRRRQQQSPATHVFTVKRVLALLFVLYVTLPVTLAQTQITIRLGTKCQHDMDCTDFLKGSSCSTSGYCECAPYFVQYNDTTCLSSQLLGGDCILDDQCTMKVANSSCLDGACRCVEGFLQFRKHTCLGPALPGAVCYSHAHCQMFDARTHCDFLIPNLFGRCQCTAPAKLVGGFCMDANAASAAAAAAEIAATSTSTTAAAPITAAPTTTTTTTTTTTATATLSTTAMPAALPPLLAADEHEEHAPTQQTSAFESELGQSPADSDADTEAAPAAEVASTTTAQQLLTPAEAPAEMHNGDEIAPELTHEVTAGGDDYPYKIEYEYGEQEQQQQQHEKEQQQQQHEVEEQHVIEEQQHEIEEQHQNAIEQQQQQEHIAEEEQHIAEQTQLSEQHAVEQAQLAEEHVAEQEQQHQLEQSAELTEATTAAVEVPFEQLAHVTPDAAMYEEIGEEGEYAAAAVDDTMKFDYEAAAQEEYNAENTEAPEVVEEADATLTATPEHVEHDTAQPEEHEETKVHEETEQATTEAADAAEHVPMAQSETVQEQTTAENVDGHEQESNVDVAHESEIEAEAVQQQHTADVDVQAAEQVETEAQTEAALEAESATTAAEITSVTESTADDVGNTEIAAEQQQVVVDSDNVEAVEQSQAQAEIEAEHAEELAPPQQQPISADASELHEQTHKPEFEPETETVTAVEHEQPEVPEQPEESEQPEEHLDQEVHEQQMSAEEHTEEETAAPTQQLDEYDAPEQHTADIAAETATTETAHEALVAEDSEAAESLHIGTEEAIHEAIITADEAPIVPQATATHDPEFNAEALEKLDASAIAAATEAATQHVQPEAHEEEEEQQQQEQEQEQEHVAQPEEHTEQSADLETHAPLHTVEIDLTTPQPNDNRDDAEHAAETHFVEAATEQLAHEEQPTLATTDAVEVKATEAAPLTDETEASGAGATDADADTDTDTLDALQHVESPKPTVATQPITLEEVAPIAPVEANAEQLIPIVQSDALEHVNAIDELHKPAEQQNTDEQTNLLQPVVQSPTEHSEEAANLSLSETSLELEHQEQHNAASTDATNTAQTELDYGNVESFEMLNNGNAHMEHADNSNNEVENEVVEQPQSQYDNFNGEDGYLQSHLAPEADANANGDSDSDSNSDSDSDGELFEETESFANILSDLMSAEATTIRPLDEDNEVAHELDLVPPQEHVEAVPDLIAEDTNINEAQLAQHAEAEGTTETQSHNGDKLITFYPEIQALDEQLSNDIEAHKSALPAAAAPEPEVHSEQPAAATTEVTNQPAEADAAHTLSPEELPFDMTAIDDVQPQALESDNLVVESTTAVPEMEEVAAYTELPAEREPETETVAHPAEAATVSELDADAAVVTADALSQAPHEEATATPGDIVEITTQTMLGLASRVTLMEPAAPIVTTLKPLMSTETAADSDATPEPVKELSGAEHLLTAKPLTEIRKRVELGSEAVSLGLNCLNDRQCQLADPNAVCNARGICDCAAAAAGAATTTNGIEAQCSAKRTGCAPGTFQCRSSGVCISWFFVCDGRPDCNDDSDEECTYNARLNQTCPGAAFQCEHSGRCISRAARCDGRKQCPHGEDEIGCSALRNGECPPHTFRCKSGECLPEYEYCNAIISCKDGSDEPPHLCGSRSMPTFFLRLLNAGGLLEREDTYCPHRCSNGRCRSTAIVCSGRDGCGDGTDEQTCSVCRCPAPSTSVSLPAYLARHRPMPLW